MLGLFVTLAALTVFGSGGAVRRFNTEGPVRPDMHYSIPPLARLDDVDRVLGLVRDMRYFVLHAPRQTGKTSALLALRDLLNTRAAGDLHCVYVNIEPAQAVREDVMSAMQVIVGDVASRARASGDGFLYEAWPGIFATFGARALQEALSRWAEESPKPLVVLIDEIDTLVGDTLISVLRQLRAGYDQRPERYPQSVVLCGVRDVRDYRIRSSSGEIITGGSAFNIKAESLRLGDFTEAETRALLAQHTEESGQVFTATATAAVWRQTKGQPWLVNALCERACFRGAASRDRTLAITEEAIFDAREQLILARETHLDQFADKLDEDRVRRVVEPLLRGDDEEEFAASNLEHARDIEYVRDLGLIARQNPVRMANPIYAEVVPRELSYATQARLVQEAAWYVRPDGDLDVDKLMGAFQTFFREHSEHWLGRFDYQEAGPQLLLQGFLQRIVIGGGRIEREYGLGYGRTDLLIVWPFATSGGAGAGETAVTKTVVECKVLHRRHGLETTIAHGLEQTARYMDRCGSRVGHLVIFDPSPDKSWDEKVFRRDERAGARSIVVWGM